MKSGLSKVFRNLVLLLYQIPIRMYEIFPKSFGARSVGFGIFGVSVTTNLISIFTFFIKTGIINKKREDDLITLSFFLGVIICIIAISFYDDYNEILKDENEKGRKYNFRWRLITWIYMAITVALAIIASKI
jgi:hypothetical protein